MQFDLGLGGLALLLLISLGFGVLVQLTLGRGTTHWLWLIGAAAWFVGGLFASEVVWGGATVEELQPVIDGLLLDESLLGGVVVGLPAVVIAWFVTRRTGQRGPVAH